MIRLALLLAAMAAALNVGACGRRGSPEPPAATQSMKQVPVDPTDPHGTKAPDRSFVLDPILQ
ncbi:lipoprotein [Acuticoccus sp. M5D2P5]|uniref:lipoprotein n=1 Tax=Acuticoccus kalidii TaxID=2910977 RepID=UPI001F41BB75|nr:lipoprotein [Acuticoccus kalidii]MCF3932777.1 lipoprotein [Acuticoccus kalidii]